MDSTHSDASTEAKHEPWVLEVFYDGDCPLCDKEIRLLRRLDSKHRIRFTNIADPKFDPGLLGNTMEQLMASIQARRSDGEWVNGVEVFRQLYAAVGFGPLVSLTRLRPVAASLDWGYNKFAKNRLRWTGRCDSDGACRAPS